MKQLEDTKTGDLLGAKRPVGRPRSGTAMTPAERQKSRRDRLKASGSDFLTVEVDAEVAAALRKFIEFKDETLGEAVTRILRDRLLRKR